MGDILVLYHSRDGATEALAREVSRGVDGVSGMASRLRTVAPVSSTAEATTPPVPESGPPYATASDMTECDGLILGSPTHFGNMSAALKSFLDTTVGEWLQGALAGKPAGVFTSTSSLHGGSESTLLTMAIPLIHHGMIFVGVPYTDGRLASTRSGGSPYGASHVTFGRVPDSLTNDEKQIARGLGARVADIAGKLAS